MEVGIKLSTYTDSPLVNESLYWKLVGSLSYLTTTQSDLCFLVICLFLNSCLIPKSYIGKLQNESVNIQRDPWLWHSISEICWLHASRAYWFQLRWISWYKEVRNRLCVHSWFRKVISWQSNLQATVALSSIDKKYKADFSTGCEAMWLRRILVDLQLDQAVITSLFCDNQSALKMAKNSVYHAITKHIEVHHNYIR